MTLLEAINTVGLYLSRHQIGFTLHRAWEVETGFKVTIHQVYPENKVLAFDVLPTDIADCWNVVEVAA